MKKEKILAQQLIKKKKTLSVMESCTGGLLTDRLTNIPGSSRYFCLGIVAYANKAKEKMIGIPASLLRQYGAVSEPVAKRLAVNGRKILKTDYGIGITGIAGPSGESREKPAGLVYIALSSPKDLIYRKYIFKGSRRAVKSQAADQAMQMLIDLLKSQ